MVQMISGEGCCGLLVPSLSARRCFCGELVTCAKTGYMQFRSIQCLDHCTGVAWLHLLRNRPAIVHLVHSTLCSPFYNYLEMAEHPTLWNTRNRPAAGYSEAGYGDEIYKRVFLWEMRLSLHPFKTHSS